MSRTQLIALLIGLAAALPAADGKPTTLEVDAKPERSFELKGAIPGALVREIGRQAVLIAARDELRLATRDATLGELPAEPSEEAIRLRPVIRSYWEPKPTTLLFEPDGEPDAEKEPTDAASLELQPRELDRAHVYVRLAEAWEAASRSSLVELLEQQGIEASARPAVAVEGPSDEVEQLLHQMSFISQYAALCLAHDALDQGGDSAEWLGVLSRGYAHLGTLIGHHWTSAPEAFIARSLLYAQRARHVDPDSTAAAWLLPYALSMAGAHSAALEQAESLAADDKPLWATVVDPHSRFDEAALLELADGEEALTPLCHWLVVAMHRTLGKHPGYTEIARDAIPHVPAAYGMYAGFISNYPSLGDSRYGAYTGPQTLARYGLYELGAIPDLPEQLREQIPTSGEEFQELIDRLGGAQDTAPFYPTSRLVIDELKGADTKAETPREPSWTMLASLFEEERFVMVANYCKVLKNATESDNEERIRPLLELIGEHRYWPHIALASVPSKEWNTQARGLIAGLEIEEPRFNMKPLIHQMCYLPRDRGNWSPGSRVGKEALDTPDMRLPSLAEEITDYVDWWGSTLNKSDWRSIIDSYRVVSPHSPHWLRMELEQRKSATDEELDEWSKTAGKDRATCEGLGRLMRAAERYSEAIDWYERAYELEPTADNTIAIAQLLWVTEDFGAWLPRLERYLTEVQSRGLSHSKVQLYIAETFMQFDKDYERALPYAMAAGQTYSARGLWIAMEAYEGLGDWDEADRWARIASESYPTGSGDVWWLHRVRNGRQDADEAYSLASRLMAPGGSRWCGVLTPLLSGDSPTALNMVFAEAKKTRDQYWWLLAALLASEQRDADRFHVCMAGARDAAKSDRAKSISGEPEAILFCTDLFEAGDPRVDEQELETLLSKTPSRRRMYQLFIGAILQEVEAQPELSDRLLRECLETHPFHNINGHLAGFYLARKHGAARSEAVTPIKSPNIPAR